MRITRVAAHHQSPDAVEPERRVLASRQITEQLDDARLEDRLLRRRELQEQIAQRRRGHRQDVLVSVLQQLHQRLPN